MSAHQHQWRLVMHLDGCHFYSSTYACDCGARRTTEDERDIKGDPYAAVWMIDGDECERCTELLDGARPHHNIIEVEYPK